MNERIKELHGKAFELTEWESLDWDKVMEKFAELIIQECISQAHGVADLRGVNDDMIYGADTAAVRISKHFGFKE
jgi:hypothetical protein